MNAITERLPTAASFAQFLAEHRLMATHCAICDALYLPPRAICPQCHGEVTEWVELEGKGVLMGFASIHIVPSAMAAAGFDRNHPYLSGIVRLDEGVSISARIVGVDATAPSLAWIGAQVHLAWLDEGEGETKATTLAFAPD